MKIELSNITCGHSCWYAKEIDCKCSCGGRNHGILLTDGAEQPERTKRVGNQVYTLQAIGNRIELMEIVNRLLPTITGEPKANAGWFECNPSKAGSPLLVNYVTLEQARKWKELTKYKDLPKAEFYFTSPSILWRRSDIQAELFD